MAVSEATSSDSTLATQTEETADLADLVVINGWLCGQRYCVTIRASVRCVIIVRPFVCDEAVAHPNPDKVEIPVGKSNINLLRDCDGFTQLKTAEMVRLVVISEDSVNPPLALVVFAITANGAESEGLPPIVSV